MNWFEHDRWFDIVRTGQAKSVMAADGKTFVEGKHELFPIPQNSSHKLMEKRHRIQDIN
jgi:hypothetical protein